MTKEKLLVDPSASQGNAKKVLVSSSPDQFRVAGSETGKRILEALSTGPRYPAEIARDIGTHHQSVYYHIGRLEKAGLILKVGDKKVRGGRARMFVLSSDGYAVEYERPGGQAQGPIMSRSASLGRFFKEFIRGTEFDGWVVVGSPLQHGAGGTQARDGHYAVQIGFALGQYVNLPGRFPVKLDVDLKAERLEGSNLVVVGGPRTNLVSEALNEHLPVKFRESGFWGSITDPSGRSFASEFDAIVAKVANPWAEGRTCIVAAGLTGAGTKAAIIGICNFADVLFQKYQEGNYAAVLRGTDKDGDGKVDSVEVLSIVA